MFEKLEKKILQITSDYFNDESIQDELKFYRNKGLTFEFGFFRNKLIYALHKSGINANIKGNQRVGGIIGQKNGGIVYNISVSGIVTSSNDHTGSIVGYNSGGSIINCHSSSNVSGASQIGGLVGMNINNGVISNSSSSGFVTISLSSSGSSTISLIDSPVIDDSEGSLITITIKAIAIMDNNTKNAMLVIWDFFIFVHNGVLHSLTALFLSHPYNLTIPFLFLNP